jgi:hypothetical protein
MFIHYYHNHSYMPSYPYVCSFFRPYDPKLTDMLAWLEHTYQPDDLLNRIMFGEVAFRHESDAALFMLRWR